MQAYKYGYNVQMMFLTKNFKFFQTTNEEKAADKNA